MFITDLCQYATIVISIDGFQFFKENGQIMCI